ncbi:MAG: nitroreductase family protein [Paludibacter sp.]|nr:nitroreductase family protein [Paludibacter sp.]
MDYSKEIEAIKARHSVRQYLDQKIDADKIEKIQEKIKELNEVGNLHLQFIEDAGDTFNKILNKALGLGSAPSVIACVGTNADDLDERVGYYGEQLVLFVQQLGLNTCWVGTFNRKKIAASVSENEKLVIAIAIGYGAASGKEHKSKDKKQVISDLGEKPNWFDYGVELALLAPTALNQQKFEITYNDSSVIIRDKGGVMGKIDLGIVKYHFEVGERYCKEAAEEHSNAR